MKNIERKQEYADSLFSSILSVNEYIHSELPSASAPSYSFNEIDGRHIMWIDLEQKLYDGKRHVMTFMVELYSDKTIPMPEIKRSIDKFKAYISEVEKAKYHKLHVFCNTPQFLSYKHSLYGFFAFTYIFLSCFLFANADVVFCIIFSLFIHAFCFIPIYEIHNKDEMVSRLNRFPMWTIVVNYIFLVIFISYLMLINYRTIKPPF